jgi:hypothetical protein
MLDLLFLDIDCVLNSERPEDSVRRVYAPNTVFWWVEEDLVRLLSQVLDVGPRIVLCSDWRVMFGLEVTRSVLSAAGFPHPEAICDSTPVEKLTLGPIKFDVRSKEVLSYCSRVKPDRWIVLDDYTCYEPAFKGRVVQPDSKTGVTQSDIDRVCKYFS